MTLCIKRPGADAMVQQNTLNRSTLKLSDLDSFFATCPRLFSDDAKDFERDIDHIRLKNKEILSRIRRLIGSRHKNCF